MTKLSSNSSSLIQEMAKAILETNSGASFDSINGEALAIAALSALCKATKLTVRDLTKLMAGKAIVTSKQNFS